MLRTSGTKLLAAALTVVLAGVCLADGYLIHGRRPAAAPPGGPPYSDDFSTDPFASRWTVDQAGGGGSITWQSGTSDVDLQVAAVAEDALMRYNTALDTVEQCVCGTIAYVDGSSQGSFGAALRGGSDFASGYLILAAAYHAAGASTASAYISVESGGAWSCDVAHATISATASYTVCVQISGTGAWNDGASGTKLRMWVDPASADCTGTPDVGYTDWTNDSGSGCLSAGVTSSTDTQKYVGWGTQEYGAVSTHTLDDWYADDM